MNAVAAAEIDGTSEGPDPGKGRLFDVPRVAVIVDESDPTVVKIAFSGQVELDRANATQVGFYNDLQAGREAQLVVTCHVAGARQVHRRDSEGDVDAIVQTKSLIVTDLYFDQAED